MDFRVISAITDFIFVSDKPQKADVIFLPGGSNPALPEAAAKLYREGFAPLVIPSGKYSVSKGKFCGVKAKADIYNKNYQTECEFYTDVLLKNGVSDNAISGEAEAGHTRDNADFSRKLTDEKG